MKVCVCIVALLLFMAGLSAICHFGLFSRKVNHTKRISRYGNLLVIDGCVELKINKPLNKSTRISYLIPVDDYHAPLPTAKNLVFYVPFNGEHKRNIRDIKMIKKLWRDYGFSVATLRIKTDLSLVNSRRLYYVYKEAGWFDVIFKAHDIVCSELNVGSVPMYLIGESSGGSLIHNLIVSNPDKVQGAAWCGGRLYDDWISRCDVPMLAISTWGCPGTYNTDKTVERQKAFGGNILRVHAPWRKPGDCHSAGEEASRLMQLFIKDIIESKAAKSEEIVHSMEFHELLESIPAVKKMAGNPNYDSFLFFKCLDKESRNIMIFLADSSDPQELSMVKYDLWKHLSKCFNVMLFEKSKSVTDEAIAFNELVNSIEVNNRNTFDSLYIGGSGISGCIAANVAEKNLSIVKGCIAVNSPDVFPLDDFSLELLGNKLGEKLLLVKSSEELRHNGIFSKYPCEE